MKSDFMAIMLAALVAIVSAADDTTYQPTVIINNVAADNYPGRLSNVFIGGWIQPNCFMGIAFTLFFIAFFSLGITMLHQIQTPLIMREKTLNWGKVEEAE